MKLRNRKSIAVAIVTAIVALLLAAGGVLAQGPPPIPAVYSGAVIVGDEPAPDGAEVWATIEDYSSSSVEVSGGQYEFLLVALPSGYEGKTIEFYVNGVKADQTDVFQPGTFHDAFDLTTPSVVLMAAFTATPTTGEAPLTVRFADHSIGEVTEWLWSFGDEESSDVQNPSHTYISSGSYSVSLTVTGTGGADTQTKTDYITVLSFSLSDLTVSPAEVNTGDTVTISVLVTNTGDVDGSCNVSLKINGVVEATKEVTVAAGGSEQVSFSTSKDAAGTYWVDIRGLTGSFKVNQVGAEFTLSNFTVTPAEVNIGETVSISVLVANTGDVAGSYNVSLKINGVVEATKEVTVAAGGSEQVSFSTSKDAAATYWVDVGGLSGSFKVAEKTIAPTAPSPSSEPPESPPPPASSATEVNWLVVALAGAVVVLVGVVSYLLARRRGRAY